MTFRKSLLQREMSAKQYKAMRRAEWERGNSFLLSTTECRWTTEIKLRLLRIGLRLVNTCTALTSTAFQLNLTERSTSCARSSIRLGSASLSPAKYTQTDSSPNSIHQDNSDTALTMATNMAGSYTLTPCSSMSSMSSTHSRRSSLSSLSSLTPLTPMTPPSSDSLASSYGFDLDGFVAGSPHEVLLYQPEMPISFQIEKVIKVEFASPVADSKAATFTEMRVKIKSERDTYIRASV